MRTTVRLASALRTSAGGAADVDLEVGADPTVRAVLDALATAHPTIGWKLRDEAGDLRRHVNIFVGEENVRDLGGLDTPVPDGAVVTVLPAVSGG